MPEAESVAARYGELVAWTIIDLPQQHPNVSNACRRRETGRECAGMEVDRQSLSKGVARSRSSYTYERSRMALVHDKGQTRESLAQFRFFSWWAISEPLFRAHPDECHVTTRNSPWLVWQMHGKGR